MDIGFKREKIMLKNFSIENWILGGTSFILIFTLGCYLWFQNEISSIELHYPDTEVEIQHVDEPSDTKSIETPLIDITDKEEQDTEDKNSTDTDDTDEEISDVTATQSHNTHRDNHKVYTPWHKQTTVVQTFNLKI